MTRPRTSFALALGAAFGLALLPACSDDTETGTTTTSSSSSSSGSASGGGGQGGDGAATGGGGEGGSGGAVPRSVSIAFEARVGAEPAACGSVYTDLGTEAGDVELGDLRFYVHDLRLVTADRTEVPVALTQDGIWQFEDVALLDFEDGTGSCAGTGETNHAVTGTVPEADYVGLAFRLGVPFGRNHEDSAAQPSPLNVGDLYWNWGAGHIFVRLDTTASTEATPANLHSVHLGSTGCTGDPELGEVVECSSPNRPEYAFDGFHPDAGVVVLDLAALLAGSDLVTDGGCQSFPDTPACVAPFEAFGIDYASGDMTPETQTLFSVE